MDAILNWMKGILILFLIGHVMLYLVQNKLMKICAFLS